MRSGDLSNEVQPRVALLFEGVLGAPLAKRPVMYQYSVRQKWAALAALWELAPTTMKSINQMASRDNVAVDIYTLKYGEEFAEALALRFNAINLLVSNVWYVSEEDLVAMASAGTNPKYIYDSDVKRLDSYGFRGFGVKFGGALTY